MKPNTTPKPTKVNDLHIINPLLNHIPNTTYILRIKSSWLWNLPKYLISKWFKVCNLWRMLFTKHVFRVYIRLLTPQKIVTQSRKPLKSPQYKQSLSHVTLLAPGTCLPILECSRIKKNPTDAGLASAPAIWPAQALYSLLKAVSEPLFPKSDLKNSFIFFNLLLCRIFLYQMKEKVGLKHFFGSLWKKLRYSNTIAYCNFEQVSGVLLVYQSLQNTRFWDAQSFGHYLHNYQN